MPSSELAAYVNSALAAGKTAVALRAELLSAGWPATDVDAALEMKTAATMPEGSAAKTISLVPWKLIIIVSGVAAIALIGVALFLFFGRKIPSPPDASNALSVNAPASVAPVENAKSNDSSGGKAKDDAAINDLDLIVYSSNIPDSANAYLNEAALRGVAVRSSTYPGVDILKQLSGAEAWNQDFADDLINANGNFITKFSTAVGKPGFQVAEYDSPRSYDPTAAAVEYKQLNALTDVLALEALSLSKKGDTPDGAAEALALAVYGQKMADSQIDKNGYLIGLGIKKLGLQTLMKILSASKVSPELAGRLDGTLASFDDASSSLAISFKIGYWIDRNKLVEIAKDPSKYYPDIAPEKFNDLNFFEPNKTINLLGEYVRSAIVLAGGPCRVFSDAVLSDADAAALKTMAGENGFGKFYASDLQTGWAGPLNARCADASLTASARAALAPLMKGK